MRFFPDKVVAEIALEEALAALAGVARLAQVNTRRAEITPRNCSVKCRGWWCRRSRSSTRRIWR